MENHYDPSMLSELLRIYYNRLFPYESYMKWINGSGQVPIDKNYVSKREFSFTLADDIYLRYLSFANAEDLKAEMVKRIPHKIDIGAVFNAKPSDHKKIANFQPQEKELVFDIGNVQLFVNLIFILYTRCRFKIVCLQTKLASLTIRKYLISIDF